MNGVEVTELTFDDLASEIDTYNTAVRRSETRTRAVKAKVGNSTGSVAFPLTERIALDLAAHGEAWTRSYHNERGVPSWQLDVLLDGARRVIKDGVTTTRQAEEAGNDARWMPLDLLRGGFANTEPMIHDIGGRAA